MADEETLTLKMRVLHALRAAREIRQVAKAVDDVDDTTSKVSKTTKKAEQATGIFGKSLGRANLGVISIAFSLQGLAIAMGAVLVLLPFLALGLAAVTAAAALMIPAFALGFGIFARFKAQAGIAGTAANKLKHGLADAKDGFQRMVAPGADIVMTALADILVKLRPLLMSLKGPMTEFAQGVAAGLGNLAEQLPTIMPMLGQLFRQGGAAFAQILPQIIPMLAALLRFGIQGIPALVAIVTWLSRAIVNAVNFIGKIVAWTKTPQGQRYLRDIGELFRLLAQRIGQSAVALMAILNFLAPVLFPMFEWFIAKLKMLNDAFQWIIDNTAPGVDGALRLIGDAVDFLSQKFQDLWGWVEKVVGGIAKIPGVKQAIGAFNFAKGAGGSVLSLAGGAQGGVISRPGLAVVGERGPEVVHMPSRARIDPLPSNPQAAGPTHFVIEATFITPDGQVLARQVHQAAARKKATR